MIAPGGNKARKHNAMERLLDPTVSKTLDLKRRGRTKEKNFLKANRTQVKRIESDYGRARSATPSQATGGGFGSTTPRAVTPSRTRPPSRARTPSRKARTAPKSQGSGARAGLSVSGSSSQVLSVHGNEDEDEVVPRLNIRGKPSRPSTAQARPSTASSRPPTGKTRPTTASSRPPTGSRPRTASKKAGKLPAYLVARKAQWAQNAKDQADWEENEANAPPGHVLLPDTERVQCLSKHKKILADLSADFRGLSVTSDTVRYVRYTRPARFQRASALRGSTPVVRHGGAAKTARAEERGRVCSAG